MTIEVMARDDLITREYVVNLTRQSLQRAPLTSYATGGRKHAIRADYLNAHRIALIINGCDTAPYVYP